MFETVTTDTPEKSLLATKKRSGGRNATGRMTIRNIGGGHKQRYRIIDFKREKFGVEGKVKTIEYDPNRSARIALVVYADGEKRYIIAPTGLEVGQVILSGKGVQPEVGNTLYLSEIPLGTIIHNIEMKPGGGGQIARAAGTYVQLIGKDAGFAQLRLGSGELRMVPARCMATIGSVSNADNKNTNMGKAGRNRWLGKRPSVRGVAMNPVDHPHGGGEGRSSGGRHPVTPWGVPTKGKRTRGKKPSDKYIMRRRHKR